MKFKKALFMEDLTKEIKKVLDTPDGEVDIEAAALLLLKMNRNRILHDSIIRRKNVEKLKYELGKIHAYRSLENAAEETKALEKTAVAIVKKTFPQEEKRQATEEKGRRADHDQLPDGIKAKYLENGTIYPRMRKLHEQLKLMNTSLPCDRYPFLKELKELDGKLQKNWDEYDAFVTGTEQGETPAGNPPAVDAKEISAARKYLSDSKSKLAELRAQEDQSHYLALLEKAQKRLDFLLGANAGISAEQLSELKALGLDAQ
jgi:hypothetical protein